MDIALSGNQKYPSIFNSKKLHKLYMLADIGDTGRGDKDDIALSGNKESLAEDTDMILNGWGEDDVDDDLGHCSKKMMTSQVVSMKSILAIWIIIWKSTGFQKFLINISGKVIYTPV